MSRVSEEYILNHFSEAIDRGFIQPFYQPITRSITGRVCCLEALARWQDPEHGLLSPVDFIPVLEENGRICDLDMAILRQACGFYRDLQERKTPIHAFSVNLSRYDFRQADLFERVGDCLAEFSVPPAAVRLEITESIMLEDEENFQRLFSRFHEAGYSIWIDDFGSGYSSLNVLQNYRFDTMKFDMLFLRNFSVKGKQVLASLINMAKTLNIHTLVEGVETEEQRDFLRSIGCETQQGYYYSKPLSVEDLLSFLDGGKMLAEEREERDYWSQIGRLNVLSPSPLADYDNLENIDFIPLDSLEESIASLALMECSGDKMKYIYASDGYVKKVLELGYESMEELEYVFNEKQSGEYLMLHQIIQNAISQKTTQELNYSHNGIYYTLEVRCLARRKDRAMLAVELEIFDSQQEKKTKKDNLQYGNALFSTYEIVTLVYPRRGSSTRIYAANLVPAYDNIQAASLEESIRNFCRAEILPEDQNRYLRFFDLNTLEARVGDSPRGFVQEAFRLKRAEDPESRWRNIRISRVPSDKEVIFIYTIQVFQKGENRILDVIAKEYPELMQR